MVRLTHGHWQAQPAERMVKGMEKMRIFHWETKSSNACTADGWVIATDRAEAKKKIGEMRQYPDGGHSVLDDDDCGRDGAAFDSNGIAVTWKNPAFTV